MRLRPRHLRARLTLWYVSVLAVLLVLAIDALRYYKINPSSLGRRTRQTTAGWVAK